jgi:hypothetical protein
MAKGVRLRLLSLRGSWVQIPPPAPFALQLKTLFFFLLPTFTDRKSYRINKKEKYALAVTVRRQIGLGVDR